MLLPAGLLGDRYNPKVIILIGGCTSISSNILFSMVSTFECALLLQLLNGLGQAMAWPPLTRLIAEWYSEREIAPAMNMLLISAALGPTVAYILTGYLISVVDWRTAFIVPPTLQ